MSDSDDPDGDTFKTFKRIPDNPVVKQEWNEARDVEEQNACSSDAPMRSSEKISNTTPIAIKSSPIGDEQKISASLGERQHFTVVKTSFARATSSQSPQQLVTELKEQSARTRGITEASLIRRIPVANTKSSDQVKVEMISSEQSSLERRNEGRSDGDNEGKGTQDDDDDDDTPPPLEPVKDPYFNPRTVKRLRPSRPFDIVRTPSSQNTSSSDIPINTRKIVPAILSTSRNSTTNSQDKGLVASGMKSASRLTVKDSPSASGMKSTPVLTVKDSASTSAMKSAPGLIVKNSPSTSQPQPEKKMPKTVGEWRKMENERKLKAMSERDKLIMDKEIQEKERKARAMGLLPYVDAQGREVHHFDKDLLQQFMISAKREVSTPPIKSTSRVPQTTIPLRPVRNEPITLTPTFNYPVKKQQGVKILPSKSPLAYALMKKEMNEKGIKRQYASDGRTLDDDDSFIDNSGFDDTTLDTKNTSAKNPSPKKQKTLVEQEVDTKWTPTVSKRPSEKYTRTPVLFQSHVQPFIQKAKDIAKKTVEDQFMKKKGLHFNYLPTTTQIQHMDVSERQLSIENASKLLEKRMLACTPKQEKTKGPEPPRQLTTQVNALIHDMRKDILRALPVNTVETFARSLPITHWIKMRGITEVSEAERLKELHEYERRRREREEKIRHKQRIAEKKWRMDRLIDDPCTPPGSPPPGSPAVSTVGVGSRANSPDPYDPRTPDYSPLCSRDSSPSRLNLPSKLLKYASRVKQSTPAPQMDTEMAARTDGRDVLRAALLIPERIQKDPMEEKEEQTMRSKIVNDTRKVTITNQKETDADVEAFVKASKRMKATPAMRNAVYKLKCAHEPAEISLSLAEQMAKKNEGLSRYARYLMENESIHQMEMDRKSFAPSTNSIISISQLRCKEKMAPVAWDTMGDIPLIEIDDQMDATPVRSSSTRASAGHDALPVTVTVNTNDSFDEPTSSTHETRTLLELKRRSDKESMTSMITPNRGPLAKRINMIASEKPSTSQENEDDETRKRRSEQWEKRMQGMSSQQMDKILQVHEQHKSDVPSLPKSTQSGLTGLASQIYSTTYTDVSLVINSDDEREFEKEVQQGHRRLYALKAMKEGQKKNEMTDENRQKERKKKLWEEFMAERREDIHQRKEKQKMKEERNKKGLDNKECSPEPTRVLEYRRAAAKCIADTAKLTMKSHKRMGSSESRMQMRVKEEEVTRRNPTCDDKRLFGPKARQALKCQYMQWIKRRNNKRRKEGIPLDSGDEMAENDDDEGEQEGEWEQEEASTSYNIHPFEEEVSDVDRMVQNIKKGTVMKERENKLHKMGIDISNGNGVSSSIVPPSTTYDVDSATTSKEHEIIQLDHLEEPQPSREQEVIQLDDDVDEQEDQAVQVPMTKRWMTWRSKNVPKSSNGIYMKKKDLFNHLHISASDTGLISVVTRKAWMLVLSKKEKQMNATQKRKSLEEIRMIENEMICTLDASTDMRRKRLHDGSVIRVNTILPSSAMQELTKLKPSPLVIMGQKTHRISEYMGKLARDEAERIVKQNEAIIAQQVEYIEMQKKLLDKFRNEIKETLKLVEEAERYFKEKKKEMLGDCESLQEYRKLSEAREHLMNVFYETTMQKMKKECISDIEKKKVYDVYKKEFAKKEKALVREVNRLNDRLNILMVEKKAEIAAKKEAEKNKQKDSRRPSKKAFSETEREQRRHRLEPIVEAMKSMWGPGIEGDEEKEREQNVAMVHALERKFGITLPKMTVEQDRAFCEELEIPYRTRSDMKKRLAEMGIDIFCSQRAYDGKTARDAERRAAGHVRERKAKVEGEKRVRKKNGMAVNPGDIYLHDGREGDDEREDYDGQRCQTPNLDEIQMGEEELDVTGTVSMEETVIIEDMQYKGTPRQHSYTHHRLLTSDEEYIEESDHDQPGPSNRYYGYPRVLPPPHFVPSSRGGTTMRGGMGKVRGGVIRR